MCQPGRTMREKKDATNLTWFKCDPHTPSQTTAPVSDGAMEGMSIKHIFVSASGPGFDANLLMDAFKIASLFSAHVDVLYAYALGTKAGSAVLRRRISSRNRWP